MKSIFLLAPAAILAVATPAFADWGATVDSIGVGDQVAQSFFWVCPPGGAPGSVWGSGLYTSDSSICTAAVHSGHITIEAGGEVIFNVLPGAVAYLGSGANGVSTLEYGAWSRSFQVIGGYEVTPVPDGVEPIDWSRTLDDFGLSGEVGRVFTVSCPTEGATVAAIWGSGPYTSDSAICVAAVHAGLISAKDGGTATFVTTGPQDAYAGSAANGVSSLGYGAWPHGFVFQ